MLTASLQIRREPLYRRAAFETGLKRLGYAVTDRIIVPESKRDLLVLWNLKRGKDENTARLFEQRGGTVLVVENGYLQKVDKTYYAISVGGHNGSGWFPVGDEDRFTPLGFELKPWQGGGYWLVCGQRGVGSSLMASPAKWGEDTAAALRRSGRDVRFRPHPGNHAPRVPLVDDLRGAQCCIIWSSAAGVRALVEGVPVEFAAPRWICEDWKRGRVTALNRMAHGQWHHEEIARGEPFARLVERPC